MINKAGIPSFFFSLVESVSTRTHHTQTEPPKHQTKTHPQQMRPPHGAACAAPGRGRGTGRPPGPGRRGGRPLRLVGRVKGEECGSETRRQKRRKVGRDVGADSLNRTSSSARKTGTPFRPAPLALTLPLPPRLVPTPLSVRIRHGRGGGGAREGWHQRGTPVAAARGSVSSAAAAPPALLLPTHRLPAAALDVPVVLR